MNNVSQKQEKIYFGLDISQKTIEIFALKGEKGVPFGKILNNQKSLNDFFVRNTTVHKKPPFNTYYALIYHNNKSKSSELF